MEEARSRNAEMRSRGTAAEVPKVVWVSGAAVAAARTDWKKTGQVAGEVAGKPTVEAAGWWSVVFVPRIHVFGEAV